MVAVWFIMKRLTGGSVADIEGRSWVDGYHGGCIEICFSTVVPSFLVNRVERSIG